MKINTEALQAYADAGVSIMPLRGDTKMPLKDWRRREWEHTDALAKIESMGGNVGVAVPDGLIVFDHDPRNDFDNGGELAAMFAHYGLDLNDCPAVETGGGGTHVYVRAPKGIKFRNTVPDFGSVEIKAYGRLVVAAGGVHKSGKHYKWREGPALKDAPELPTALLEAITRPAPVADYAPDSARIEPEQLAKMLAGLDPANFNTNDAWFPVMGASHHATGGAGLDVFTEWSTKDPAFANAAADIESRWRSLHKNKRGGYTIRTLNKLLKEAGRADLMHFDRTDAADDFEDFSEPTKANRLQGLSFRDWMNLVDPKWLIEGVIAENALFEIFGQFKSGKTFFGIEMACCIATGADWLDETNTTRGRVLYVIAEGNRKMFARRIEQWIAKQPINLGHATRRT